VLVFAPNSGVQFCTDLETNFHVSCIDGIMYIAGGSCKLIRLFQTYFIYIYIYIYIYTHTIPNYNFTCFCYGCQNWSLTLIVLEKSELRGENGRNG